MVSLGGGALPINFIGIVFGIPVVATAASAYIHILNRFVLGRAPAVLLRAVSWPILLLVAVDLALVHAIGALGARYFFGPSYEDLHAFLFLAPPALGNLLVLYRRAPLSFGHAVFVVSAVIVAAFGLLLFNLDVSGSLYGPDGIGGPYSAQQ